jgi:Ca2+-binding RTX toxin-like protein
MIYRGFLRLAYIVMAGLILFSMIFAIAANNVVPVTYLTDQSSILTANELKPAACSAITLTAIFYCPTSGGTCAGTDASELVIGSIMDDDIESGKGDDCILGGGGNDSIRGEQNTDVCIGGPGADSFHPSCETETQ